MAGTIPGKCHGSKMSEDTKGSASTEMPQDSEPPRRRPWWSLPPGCRTILAHPLFLLLIGAMISSLMVPVVSRMWQVHDKELEVKEQLVADINTSLTDFVNVARFRLLEKPGHNQQEFDQAFRDWEVKRGQISTTLRIYYPHEEFAERWDTFTEGVDHFYDLSDETDPQRRIMLAGHLERCFASQGLENLHPVGAGPAQMEAEVELLVEEILILKDHLVHDVLNEESALWKKHDMEDPPMPPEDACHEQEEPEEAG
jgi:hypothetical protein